MCLAWRKKQTNKLCKYSDCSLKFHSLYLNTLLSPALLTGGLHLSLVSLIPFPLTSFFSFPSFPSSLFQQAFIHPLYYGPSPGEQAGFPAVGPDGALASQPALGLWACRTAGRPFCGRYGRGQSWHLFVTMEQQGDGKAGTQREHCQYTADWGPNCRRTHTDIWIHGCSSIYGH